MSSPDGTRRRTLALFLALVSPGVALGAAADPPAIVWVEAERYEAQQGSRAARYTMPAASGGAIVDNDWGGRAGDFLRYAFEWPDAAAPRYLTLRYARETRGAARVGVRLDGNAAPAVVVTLPSTGDWGFQPEGWRYVTAALPAVSRGRHTLELVSLADQNNVNVDGFYLSARALDTAAAPDVPPLGSDLVAPLGAGLAPLPCRTPLALPYSRRKAVVDGRGLVQTLLATPEPRGMGRNTPGPSLHVLLAGHGPWQAVEQTVVPDPVPTVVTRFQWPEVALEQAVFAAAPEALGFFLRITVRNKTAARRSCDVWSVVAGAAGARGDTDGRLVADGQVLLRMLPAAGVTCSAAAGTLPGPLGGPARLQHQVALDGGAAATFDLQFLGPPGAGAGPTYDAAHAETAAHWRARLASAATIQLPDAQLQYAFEAALRQMLMLIESRPDHARVLKGLQHYYGANPYDTFQVSRALDSVGLRADAEELLRHQLAHLKEDGIFEMWETGDLAKRGADQWIVQGLAATALWLHYEQWRDEAWLHEITPALIRAAQATLRARREHSESRPQGDVEVSGWLPPLGGDGGLGVGYHWSQNTGPLAGVRIAAEAARRLGRPEAEELRAGYEDFRQAVDTVRRRAADAAGLIPAFPGAQGAARTRPLWGVVMSATAFDEIPSDDPAAVETLRFLQRNLHGGLHLNLGYSRGVWPYLSAEVALWHARLGECDEAWRILTAIAHRASTTVCWYEEIEHDPPKGFGDPADVWAAAEMVYLTRQLLVVEQGDELRLAAGLPAACWAAGSSVSVRNVPTRWGACSFVLQSQASAVSIDVTLPSADRPKRLRVWLGPPAADSMTTLRVTGAAAHQQEARALVVEAPQPSLHIEMERHP